MEAPPPKKKLKSLRPILPKAENSDPLEIKFHDQMEKIPKKGQNHICKSLEFFKGLQWENHGQKISLEQLAEKLKDQTESDFEKFLPEGKEKIGKSFVILRSDFDKGPTALKDDFGSCDGSIGINTNLWNIQEGVFIL